MKATPNELHAITCICISNSSTEPVHGVFNSQYGKININPASLDLLHPQRQFSGLLCSLLDSTEATPLPTIPPWHQKHTLLLLQNLLNLEGSPLYSSSAGASPVTRERLPLPFLFPLRPAEGLKTIHVTLLQIPISNREDEFLRILVLVTVWPIDTVCNLPTAFSPHLLFSRAKERIYSLIQRAHIFLNPNPVLSGIPLLWRRKLFPFREQDVI